MAIRITTSGLAVRAMARMFGHRLKPLMLASGISDQKPAPAMYRNSVPPARSKAHASSASRMPVTINEPTRMNTWFLKERASLISPFCSAEEVAH